MEVMFFISKIEDKRYVVEMKHAILAMSVTTIRFQRPTARIGLF